MTDTKATPRGSNSTAKRCNQQQADAPTSGGDPPSVEYNDLFGTPALASDDPGTSADTPERDAPKDRPAEPPDGGGSCTDSFGHSGSDSTPEGSPDEPEDVEDLFGERVLGSDPERDPFAANCGDPPAAPFLPFTAQPAQRALYQQAFRAAYRYPDALMLVMQGVRKGLKRGKEAARRKEDRSP
jgi:hypothetical protein